MKVHIILSAIAAIPFSNILLLHVNGQQCAPLCGSTNQQLAIDSCATQTVSSTPFTPCCDNGSGRDDCDDGRKCRSVVFSAPVGCTGQGQIGCINPAETVSMSINLVTQQRPGACCAECSCSGDPHCYAFSGKQDDFIICDARDVKKGCAVTKSVCETQRDFAGVPCIYYGNNGTCAKDPMTPVPNMLFYQKGNVAISLDLGERGITQGVIIKEGNNVLSLNADDCINKPNNPWVGTPIGDLISSQHGRVWTYTFPGIRSELTVNCVARGTAVTFARLDVSVVDITATPGGVPSGVTGFCATGEINTGLATTEVTDAILLGSLCSSQPIANTARVFNNGNQPNNLKAFIKKWCNKYMGGVPETSTAGVQACINNINNNGGAGWAKVFCTASTIVSKDLSECDGTQDCRICTNDIMDFGWSYAIDKWDATKPNGPKPGGTCIKISDLPDDLLQCQRGIRLQYFDTITSTWVTYKAIPHGYRLCDSSGSFNSNDDAILFNNNIRFTECGAPLLPPGTCPDQGQQLCDAEDGFIVTINTMRQTETPQLGIVDMVDNNELICNPAMYPNNPMGCFEEQLNPCPTCTGKCKPTGFDNKCDNSQDACKTCPTPFD